MTKITGEADHMNRLEVLKRQKTFLESDESRTMMKEVEWTLRFHQIVEDLEKEVSKEKSFSKI